MRGTLIASIGTVTVLGFLSVAMAADKAGEKFIEKAIQGNLAEMQMGKLAQEKGGTDAVRSFGQMLVTDHSSANEKATAMAQQLGVAPPTEPSSKQKDTYDKLSKLSGKTFDREFAKMMVEDHRKDVKEFEEEAGKKGDPAAQYASETLPVLQKHLKEAETLNKEEKGASAH